MPCARVVKSARVLLLFFSPRVRTLAGTCMQRFCATELAKTKFAADLVLKGVVFLKLLPLLHRHPAILGPTVATFSEKILLECCFV